MTLNLDQLKADLHGQRQTLDELLASLRRAKAAGEDSPPTPGERKNFLALLSDSLDRIRQNRNAWLRLNPAEKAGHPEIADLLRESQNLILKILVLDRESEQARGRRGGEDAPGSEAAPVPEGSPLLKRIYGLQPPG